MPLWSNEDWRARIGSCWCALGRTFNTRFTRCRSKSQRDLSTHQAATMVIMMILFIAANMGLYATRERHKNLICVFFDDTITELHLFRFGLLLSLFIPVLRFIVHMVSVQLPRKLKMSLRQFFVDLNDGLWFIGSVIRIFIVSPVLFVMNFTMGNICDVLGKISNHLTKFIGDRLSNGILMKSLVVAIIVTIQLLVSVVVACAIILRISGDIEQDPGPGHIDYSVTKELLVELEITAVQASLLLRCGDVESNPGPLSREDIERVDCSTNLTEQHLRDILHEVVSIKYMYWQLGLELGLPPGELNSLRMTSNNDTDRALTDMLLSWLKQCHGAGTPTWRRLVEAVNSPSGGNNPSLAMTIANKHLVDGGPPIVNISHGHQPSSDLIMLPSQGYMHNTLSFSPYSHIRGTFPQLPRNNPIAQPTYAHAQAQQHYLQGLSDQCSSTSVFHSSIHVHNQQQYYQGEPLPYQQRPPPIQSHWIQQTRGAAPIQSLPSNWTLYPEQNLDEGFDSVPDPKRRKLDPSQPPLGQVPLTSHDLQHIDRWRRMLVDSYLAQEHSTDAWPPLKIVEFIKLALVKEDEQAYHLGLQTVQKDIDAVYGQKNNASYEKLFQNINNGSLVLFEGRPGSGKTTLMVRASCDWGRANIFKSKLVIFVRLRHLNKSRNVYLHDLLRVACPAFTPDDVQGLSSYIEGRLGEDVVFLLDGFDEYTPGASDDNYISKLILKLMYTRSIIILSSRPAATQRFRQNATLWIEVVGFKKEQVLQYINCYFERNKEKSSSLVKHLEEHENLMNLCYLPLHCAMLVFLYKVDATLPETETEFYRDFTLSLLIRGIRKHTNMPANIESFDCLPISEQIVFHKVCKLAFKATLDSRQVFKEHELKDICFHTSSEDSLGLVVVDRYFAKSGIDETYTFLHLTLQEYLAAVFVSRLNESEQISTIATHFFKEHLFVTSCFLFGIMDYSKEITKNLFKQMLVATKSAHLHHIRCAYECYSASACTDVVNFHKKSLSFESINNSSDIFYITFVLKTVKYVAIELSFSECNFDISDAVSILQGVGDRQLSLTIKQGKAAQSMLNALSRVTVSGLVELVVDYKLNVAIGDKYLTMETNHLQHSTKLQKLDLEGIDVSNSGVEEAFKLWPNLVKLKLDQCHCHVTSVAEVLEEGLQHMTKVHHTNDQTLEITLEDCDFNKEATVGLLQAVGDRRLSLTIIYNYMDTDAQPLVDALCLVTLPGLIELNVTYVDDEYLDYDICPIMGPNNLKHSTNLRKLNLCGLDISNSGLEKALKHWPNLVELKLDQCRCHVLPVAEVLVEGLQHMTKAHHTTDQTLEITLKDCDFNKEAAVGVLQAVGDRRLSLTITYEYTVIDNAQPLVDALCLVTLPGLIELDVANNVEDGDDPTMRPNNLKHSTNLQKLDLSWLDVSNSGLEKALKHWPNLVELGLGWCKIDASTAVVLGESLQHTSRLQNLSLDGNSIGDDGLHALSLPIKNYCKELKELRLKETQLTDRSITCLTEWIKVLNNLENLNLGSNHFSEGGVKQIEEAVSERNTREGVAKLELYISDQKPLL